VTLLDGRVAIISGIGPGMGRDAALACAREGARVVLAARTPSKVESVAAEIESLGAEALPVVTDVTDLAQIDHLIASTIKLSVLLMFWLIMLLGNLPLRH